MDNKFDPQDQYIVSESDEVNFNESPGWTDKIFSSFPALRHKNYQLYFGGQLISLIGTWLQQVAQGWMVLQLTHSAFWVGVVAACATLPVFIFALIGGVIIDRFDKKKIIIATQICSMILAFLLGILAISGHITVLQVCILAFLLGTVDAIDKPGRQAFIVEIVGREDLASAIALNSAIFNSARIIGPAIAGVIIALYGSGTAFLLNAVSYIAVIIALVQMKVKELPPTHAIHPIKAIKQGLVYGFSHPMIRALLVLTALTAIFGWSYSTIIPVIVQQVYHEKASGLGYFYAAAGIGALIGTVLVSYLSKKVTNTKLIVIGNFVFSVSIILFTSIPHLVPSLLFLTIAGLGIIVQVSTVNTTIQQLVPHELRGRIMSIYVLMFMGMAPLGNFQIGVLSEHFGPFFAIRIDALVLLAAGIALYFYFKTIRSKSPLSQSE